MSKADWRARLEAYRETDLQHRIRMERAQRRARDLRWAAKARVEVAHPLHPTVEVPHASNLAAILCAAERWRCPWWEVMDATITRVEDKPSHKKAPPACRAANTTQGA